MRKLILFGIVLLMFSFSGLAFIYNGQSCSTDPADYNAFNDSGHSWSGASVIYINNGIIPKAGTQRFMIYGIGIFWNVDGEGKMNWNPTSGETTNYLFEFIPDASGVAPNWGYYDSGMHDTGFASTHNIKHNISFLIDYGENGVNVTGNGGATYLNGGFENDLDFTHLRSNCAAGVSCAFDEYYSWNCTPGDTACNCPGATPPPAARTNTTGFNTPVFEDTTELINLTLENFNLTSSTKADLLYNGSYYSGTLNLVNNSYLLFETNVSTPLIYNNNTAVSLIWNATLFYENGSSETASFTSETQYIRWNLASYPRVNVTARNLFNGTYLDSFSVTDGTTSISTTTGEVYFNKVAGLYELTFSSSGFAYAVENVTFTSGSFSSHIFSVYPQNSILIKVYDEVTGNPIMGNISLRFSSVYEEFNNSTSNNNTFFISDLTPAEYQILVDTSGYSNRTYTVTVGNLTTQTLNVYLAASTSTVTFTVYDYDQTSTVLSDVLSTMYRLIGSDWVAVESKYTDISGKVQFSYVENANYKFYLSKTGYNNNIFYLKPILFSTYDIKMIRSSIINYSQDYDQLSVIYSPSSFNNNNESTFYFLISSPSGILTNYGFNLTYPGGSSIVSGSNAIGGQLSTSFNITNASVFDDVTLIYYYETSISGQRNFTVILPINFESDTGLTFISNRNTTYNLGVFERLLIFTIMILIVVGISAFLGQIIPGLALGLLIYGYGVYIGFIPLWSILPSMLIGVIYLMIKSQ